MKKEIFIGDTHAGLRADDPWYEENLYRVFKQITDHCKANGITTGIHAGDWFDVRKGTTQNTVNFIRTRIIPMIEEAGLTIDVIPGNHDCQYKDKIQPNAVREFLSSYSCINVVDTPTTINRNGVTIDLIPWICDQNAREIFKFIHESKSDYCVGHFELAGFYFYKNSKADHGLEPDFLKKYKRVYSGHYHHANEGDNIFYIGTPLTMSANDEDETRGFYEFTGKPELNFIANPDISHRRVMYPEQKDVDLEQFRNCSVRMFINQVDSDLASFQTEIEKVAHEISIKDNLKNDSDVDADFEIQSSLSLMLSYIEGMNHSEEDKAEIKKLVNSLHTEVSHA
ncbi:endonuclease [Pantoea phage Phynn]|nr:endonuclease [Pantoea phage Phynn]